MSPVGTIVPGCVAMELPRDRAAMSTQVPRDLRLVETLSPERCNRVAFFRGDLVIGH
jgi:hypothetical protein